MSNHLTELSYIMKYKIFQGLLCEIYLLLGILQAHNKVKKDNDNENERQPGKHGNIFSMMYV